jgi:hypothetical protein
VNTVTATSTRSVHSQENWDIVLAIAAREVFELMLDCKLTTLEAPPPKPMT